MYFVPNFRVISHICLRPPKFRELESGVPRVWTSFTWANLTRSATRDTWYALFPEIVLFLSQRVIFRELLTSRRVVGSIISYDYLGNKHIIISNKTYASLLSNHLVKWRQWQGHSLMTRRVAAHFARPSLFSAMQTYTPVSDGLASRITSLMLPSSSLTWRTRMSRSTSKPSFCLQKYTLRVSEYWTTFDAIKQHKEIVSIVGVKRRMKEKEIRQMDRSSCFRQGPYKFSILHGSARQLPSRGNRS